MTYKLSTNPRAAKTYFSTSAREENTFIVFEKIGVHSTLGN